MKRTFVLIIFAVSYIFCFFLIYKIILNFYWILEIDPINFDGNIQVAEDHQGVIFHHDTIEVLIDMIWVHHTINVFVVIGKRFTSFLIYHQIIGFLLGTVLINRHLISIHLVVHLIFMVVEVFIQIFHPMLINLLVQVVINSISKYCNVVRCYFNALFCC